ncbi:MAG: sugar-binding transcriptional regulator [Chloroflexota bacterium]|nr:MAG: sugar-binding transcriptional regulator [Chloroflexota bacterium]
MLSTEHERLLVKVSRYYYEHELTQSQISKRLRLSRQKIQRLLKQAKEQGIVQITIRPVIGAFPDLERKLEDRYGLQEAVVVETTNFEDQFVVAREVGVGAADYLMRVIQPNDVIAISWGGSLLGMVNALYSGPRRSDLVGIKVIQGLGGLGDPNKEVHAADLTRRLAQVFSGVAILLPTPAVAGTREARDAYMEDPYVRQVLDLARSAKLAVMGIGAPRSDSILMREGKIVTEQELNNLIKQDAVGDMNLRFFNSEGVLVDSSLDQRVIGLTLDEIQKIELVVGVAGGSAKIPAVRGALAGNLVDVLVTDQMTAQQVI